MDEAVDGVPPLPLSVGGQEAEERKREAARLKELLLWTHLVDFLHVLELTVAAEHHAM